ncbi:uncharacterized protein V1510DRAFT_365490 [Dipodascopsis tothii]|uniref:uncharacterized protein n=1 Tax=Dipodascopsis tothii TaxID=44089 RepID=UPI0034CEB916
MIDLENVELPEALLVDTIPLVRRAVADNSTDNATLPYAFDTGVGTNFTKSSCPDFLKTFSQQDDFVDCLPLSFFLQTSQSFFDIAAEGAGALATTLDLICSVNATNCSAVMDSYQAELVLDDNCAADYGLGNPLVVEAYNAFQAYNQLFEAGCLKTNGDDYCFVNAFDNATFSNDANIYYLPLDVALASSANATCSTCGQDIMAVFARYANDTTEALSRTYLSAAQILDGDCGNDYASTAVINTSASSSSTSASSLSASPHRAWYSVGVFMSVCLILA